MGDPQTGSPGRKRPEERGSWVCPLYGCPLAEPIIGTWADVQAHCRKHHPDYKGMVPVLKL